MAEVIMDEPVIIVWNYRYYIYGFNSPTHFNWLGDVIEYLRDNSCSQDHAEPVIHTKLIYFIIGDQLKILKGNFFTGIPLSQIIKELKEFFKDRGD